MDVHAATSTPSVVLDFFGIIAPMIKGKAPTGKMATPWNNNWGSALASAVNGGQWTQTRKAKVAAWNITDKRCQLCFEAEGTIMHRFACRTTAATRSSKPVPREGELAKTRVSCERLELLKTRGLATVRVPAQSARNHGTFTWHVDPFAHHDNDEIDNATWYTDGSLLCGKWAALRCTGFGIVVVAASGKLLGYGSGTPPTRIATAAAAELWASDCVLKMCPTPPRMKTDCMSILTAANAGVASTTSAARPLARIWRSIVDSLDGDLNQLLANGRLSWIPAHLSIRAVGERRLPDGTRLTMIDWRANRLVDILAKNGAKKHAPREDVLALVKSMTCMTRHAAAQLGETTHIANNFPQEVTTAGGKTMIKLTRDSMPKPKRVHVPPPKPRPPRSQVSRKRFRQR